MKVTLLINRDNFERYSSWDDTGWELVHMGNDVPVPEKVVATNADVIVSDAIARVGPEIITNMPNLKMVHSQGVAFNAIDLDVSRSSGIYVCNCAGTNARAVAEQAILLILALIKSFRQNEDMVYSDRQMEAKTSYFKEGLPELDGRKVGIVGYGAIGKILASMLKSFNCEVCYYDTFLADKGESSAEYLPLEELYSSCDIVSLHVPVLPETQNMINRETLKLFKPGAILINTARGELMDHDAVVDALISGQLGGLGADTLAPEPFLPDNPVLCALPPELRSRVALSPHIAGITSGFFIRGYGLIKQNISAVIRGEKPNCIVNGL